MARCQHPYSTLIFEDSPTGQSGIQIYQCDHCRAVQSHVMEAGRVEVHNWKPLPFPSMPVRHQLLCILALAKPQLRLRPPPMSSTRSIRHSAA